MTRKAVPWLLVAVTLLGLGCYQHDDVVARLSEVSVDGPVEDSGPPPSVIVDSGASVEPDCMLEEALANANLPPESLIVAATCQLPLNYLFTRGTRPGGGDDLLNFFQNSGQIEPQGDTNAEDLCGQNSGTWYLDDPQAPTAIILCEDACDWVKELVYQRIGELGCVPDGGNATDAL